MKKKRGEERWRRRRVREGEDAGVEAAGGGEVESGVERSSGLVNLHGLDI